METDVALRELREADLLRAPCPGCGSQLTFRAETQGMGCHHCSSTHELVFSREKLTENSLDGLFIEGELNPALTAEQQLFSCAGCGARTRISADQPILSCGFCGGQAVNPEAQRTRVIEPAGVLPFKLNREKATEAFRNWVGSRLLAPNDLKSGAVLDNLHGIYLPFWTFDAQAHSEWSGEQGTYYYESTSSTDSQGRRVTNRVRHTRWSYRSGTHEQFYDDVLALASNSLSNLKEHADEVMSYDLRAVVDYDPRVLLGWEAEVYAIDLAEGLERGRATIRQREEEACSRELGGDTQRDLYVSTTLTAESFKHVLLPLWLCAYVYRGEVYHFLVNGQTGRVSGTRPVSVWKVAFLVLLALLALGFIVYYDK